MNMNASLLDDLRHGVNLRHSIQAAAAEEEEPQLKPMTKQNRIDLVSLSMKLKRLFPPELTLQDMVFQPPAGLQLALLNSASPQFCRLITLASLPHPAKLESETSLRESSLATSPLNNLNIYEHCMVLSFLSVRELFLAGGLCKYLRSCLCQPLLLTAASQGLLKVGDPLLAKISSAVPPRPREEQGLALPEEQLRMDRSKPILATLEEAEATMWPDELLLEFARALTKVRKLCDKNVSEEVAREEAKPGSPAVSRVATTVRDIQSTPYADLRLEALHLLSTIRSEVVKEKAKLDRMQHSLQCLSSEPVRGEMARAMAVCLQVGRLLDDPDDTVDGPRSEDHSVFPLSSLGTLKDVKSRFHPHFSLHEAVTHLLLTTGGRSPPLLSHPDVAHTVRESAKTVLDQFGNLLLPTDREVASMSRFVLSHRPRVAPGSTSPLLQMKGQVRALRTELQTAIQGIVARQQHGDDPVLSGLKHLTALLTFVDYEFEAIEEWRLRIAEQYIELRRFVNCCQQQGEEPSTAGEEPTIVAGGRLQDSADGRALFFSFLKFLVSLTTDMTAAKIIWDEATMSCMHEQDEEKSQLKFPERRPATAEAAEQQTETLEVSKRPRRVSTGGSKVQELRDKIAQRMALRAPAHPPMPHRSSEPGLAPDSPAMREQSSTKKRTVKRWHWGVGTPQGDAQSIDSPLFQWASQMLESGEARVPIEMKEAVLKLFQIGPFVGIRKVRKHTSTAAPVFTNFDFTNEALLKGRALAE